MKMHEFFETVPSYQEKEIEPKSVRRQRCHGGGILGYRPPDHGIPRHNPKAEYGTQLLKYLPEHLTKEFRKRFTETNLKYMCQFYVAFSIGHTLCGQLSWSHCRLLEVC
jgi:hypothetical protein